MALVNIVHKNIVHKERYIADVLSFNIDVKTSMFMNDTSMFLNIDVSFASLIGTQLEDM